MQANDNLNSDQAMGLRNINNNKPVRVICITGGKGGVGKSSVSLNLAVSLAKQNNSVMLFDADMGLANIDVMLGIHPKYNLSHVVNGECSLEEVLIEGPHHIKIIPASSGIKSMSELSVEHHAGLIQAFSELSYKLNYLIVDTAAGISNSVTCFAKASQEVVVVVCNEPTSITDAYALIKLLSVDHGVNKFKILANMVRSQFEGNQLFNKLAKVTDQYLDVTLQFVGSIPNDENVRKSIQTQKPVCDLYPSTKASQAIIKFSEKVKSWPLPSKATGQVEFFVERLIQSSQMM